MKTLLVPVDYSEASLKALETALNLASRIHAKLLLCHVYQTPVYAAEVHHPVYALPLYETKQDALAKLRKFVKRVKNDPEVDVPVAYTVVVGSVVEGLLELAQKRKASLIIIGTTGRGSLENKLFGSTTKHLVKHASCPVLAVPQKARLSPVNRVVYASALEPGEAGALVQLSQLRHLFSSALTLLYVDCGDKQSQVNIDIRKNELLKDLPDDTYTFSQVRCDKVAEGIVHFVQAYNADLLAFTVSRRGFWKNMMQSSTTSRLLEELNLPMLAFPQYPAPATGFMPDEQDEEHAAMQEKPVKP
ncbi:universal stress protein [Pontibacter toksunensis]|uniref:Universal stress protein n=1 Tax=Pontibacter toksunensis TaxID=1332631 RepID=A0ABW6BX39_9BACT